MLHNTVAYILPLSVFKFTLLSAITLQEDGASFILVPHGLSPNDAERVIIPAGNSYQIDIVLIKEFPSAEMIVTDDMLQ